MDLGWFAHSNRGSCEGETTDEKEMEGEREEGMNG